MIAVAVVVHDGRVLVGRRAEQATDAAGLHEFPGGKVEPGESPEAAAERECLEETGVAIRVRRLLDRGTGSAANGPLEILFFEAAAHEDDREPRMPFTWMPLAALPALSFPAANAGVIAALVQGGS
ncbi:MAG: NUDIX domain-containing protein [Planctomycetia bacterium]|nr:NUDIX domain-containing protein [Planctomycetia bacterium]